jgi:23S rRNA pseudouridine1911/1915/1917 synthase
VNQEKSNRIEKLDVTPDDEGMRLDVFCAARIEDLSRNQIQKIIKDGGVLVGAVQRPSNYAVKCGDVVRVEIPVPDETAGRPVPEDIPLRVVYEDDSLIVINKDAGMVVHPAHGNWEGTVVNAVLGLGVPLSQLGGSERPGVVHRLDKDTSGLLVLAKTDRAYRGLSEQLKSRRVKKVYHAVSWGHMGVPSRSIDAPIARHSVHRQKMTVSARGGRDSLTEVFVVDTFGQFEYIRVIAVTGRTHQIRVHLSHISHPILGDPVYGGRRTKGLSSNPNVGARIGALLKVMQRQALHASMISFAHPVTDQRLEFKAALPEDMRLVLEMLYREDKI